MKHRSTPRLLTMAWLSLLGTGPALAQTTVLVRSPARNALAAPRPTNVTLTFSQNINPATAGGVRVFSQQRGGLKTGSYLTGGPNVTFNPSTDFRPGEKVSVVVRSSVQSAGGQAATRQVYQFQAAATGGFAAFAPNPSVEMNERNNSVALADIDNDGDLDLLASNGHDSTVAVRRNTGAGFFGFRATYNVGRRQVEQIQMADVDADNDLDLLTVNSYTGNVSVLRNNGAGLFGAPTIYDVVSSGAQRIKTGDLDADGDVDLATFGSPFGEVRVLLNDGTGAYLPGATMAVGINGFGAGDLELADMNNDGDLDVVVADFQNSAIETFANAGNATFGPMVSKTVPQNPEGMAVFDVDGDGDLDVVSEGGYVLRNNGSGTLSAPMATSGVGYVIEGAVGDIDGDGDLDMVSADLADISTALNSGTGFFEEGREMPVTGSAVSVALGDLDGDGDLDMVAGSRDTSLVMIGINSFYVVDLMPERHERTAPVGTSLALHFSGLVKPSTAAGVRVFGTRSRGRVTGSASASADTLHFNPSADFMPGELVQVSVPPAVQSSTGVGARPHVSQFVTAATGGSGWFSGTTEVLIGGSGQGATLADVNEDGHLDALSTAMEINQVAVLLGDGAGGLTPGVPVAVGAFPSNLAAGDFNGDGHLDIVVTNQNGGTLTVKMGTGTGHFGGGSTLTVGGSPVGLAVGDVDGDGDLDILTGTLGSQLRRFTNNGLGTFGPATAIPLAGGGSRLTLADVTNDGALDLIIPDGTNNRVLILRNNGNGTFAALPPVPVSDNPTRVAVVDQGGDGKLDLTVLRSDAGTLTIYRGNGDGSFTTGSSLVGFGPSTRGMSAGDLDGDGDPDFIVTYLNASPRVAYSGSYGALSMGQPFSAGGGSIYYSALGDMDHDGDLDFVSSNYSPGRVVVRLNEAQFVVTARAPERLTTSAPVSSDVVVTVSAPVAPTTASRMRVYGSQRDGRKGGVFSGVGNTITLEPLTDFAAGELVSVVVSDGVESLTGQPLRPHVYQFRAAATGGTATFAPPAVPEVASAGQPTAIVTADVNEDGNLDAVVVDAPGNNLNLHLGDGTGGFGPATVLAEGTTIADVKIADVDRDGDLDLVTARAPANNLGVRLNNGSGVFGAPATVTTSSAVSMFDIGDIDGDGNLDIVTANRVARHLNLYVGNGIGGFGFEQTVLTLIDKTFWSVTLADLENDGDLDVIAPSQDGNRLHFARNVGGQLYFGSGYTVAGGPVRVVAGDYDGNGSPDLATVCAGSNKISLLFNNLNQNPGYYYFTAAPALSVGLAPADMTTADLDGDGDLDLLTANRTSGNVSIRRNNGDGTFSTMPAPSVGSEPMMLTVGDVNNDGDVDFLTANRLGTSFSVRLNVNVAGPAPTIVSFTPDHGATGTVVTLTGTNFTGATQVTFDGVNAPGFVVNGAGTEITVASPPATFNGPIAVTTPDGTASTDTDFGVDLVISAAETIPAGDFHHITVTATGEATLGGAVEATSDVLVQTDGELADGGQVLSGTGSFTLESGAHLRLRHPQGLANAGALQLTGGLTLSTGADYSYEAALAQVTGGHLPAEVRNLTIDNAAGVSLTQATSVRQVLTMAGNGDLDLNGQELTLLSDAAGTALVVNLGAGQVSGTATAQCWLNPALNPGLGYRHLSAPTKTATVADLTTAGFTPVVNPNYNELEFPVNVQPYPNVFGYDESRAPGSAEFMAGYYSLASAVTALEPGRGYSVYMKGGLTPDFSGELTQGSVMAANLGRTGNFAANTQKSGWHLLGNPYPSPLDWDLMTVPAGLNPSISVFRSTGAGNAGVYLTRANGLGTLPDGILPLGQAFFARVDVAPVDLTFTNAARVTTFGSAAHYRGQETRPVVDLRLRAEGAAETETDGAVVYFQEGATTEPDRAFDGEKPAHNVGLPTLVSLTPKGAELAVNGLPETALTQGLTIPLLLDLPAAGTYELAIGQALNLANQDVVLLDQLTHTSYRVVDAPVVRFTVGQAGELRSRFVLTIGNASRTDASDAMLSVWPNPARGTVRVAGAAGQPLELIDATGRVVRVVTQPEGTIELNLQGLVTGVYAVRCGAQVQRLVVE